MYKKEVYLQGNVVKAYISKGKGTISSNEFSKLDISLIGYLFGTAERQLEEQFKLAHQWSDSVIDMCQKYETEED